MHAAAKSQVHNIVIFAISVSGECKSRVLFYEMWNRVSVVEKEKLLGRNLFIRIEWLFVLKTGDDERTDSNDVEVKNKRGLGTKEQVARCMVRV